MNDTDTLTEAPHFTTIQQKFERFHRDNPQVFEELVTLTYEAKARGDKRGSVKEFWEVLRWRSKLDPKTYSPFKFANHHHSRYARLIMQTYPDLDGFFRLCELKSP